VLVQYISPDAAADMPDLVGMRVGLVNGFEVTNLDLEEATTL